MDKSDDSDNNIDWTLTTWEGARREQVRCWAQLPLERIISALEEMQELQNAFYGTSNKQDPNPDVRRDVAEPSDCYGVQEIEHKKP